MVNFLSNFKRDLRGGLTVAVVSLPISVACGILALSPLGPSYIPLGALAGLSGTAFTSLIAALTGSSPVQVTGINVPLALVLAALCGALTQQVAEPQTLVLLVYLCIFLAGICQLFFGALRLGRLIKYIPYPVLAGFMNGIGLVVFTQQIDKVLGGTYTDLAAGKAALVWSSILVGAITIAATLMSAKWLKRVPATLMGLCLGTATYYGLGAALPAAPRGACIGTLPGGQAWAVEFGAFYRLFGRSDIVDLGWEMLPWVLTLAFLGMIDTLMGATAADSVLSRRHDSERELWGQGLANMGSALLGGLVGTGTRLRTMANYNAGGRTRLSGIVHGLSILILLWVMADLLSLLPLAVVGALLMVFSFSMLDRWSRELLTRLVGGQTERMGRELWANIAVVVLVAIITFLTELVLAIALGLLVACFLFIAQMSKSPIFRAYRGGEVFSKKGRPSTQLEVLKQVGAKIAVFEAQGPIFFGSADRLYRQVEAVEAQIIVLDFRRVTAVDVTGGLILQQLIQQMGREGRQLYLSALEQERPFWVTLDVMGVVGEHAPSPLFEDVDSALETAEEKLLAAAEAKGGGEMALGELDAFKNLSAEQLGFLEARLHKQEYGPNQLIMQEGDDGDSMLFVVAGTVSIKVHIKGHLRRIAGLGTGVVIGEMAILEGQPRSADVYADGKVVGYTLTRDDYWQLCEQRPDIAIKMLMNLSAELAHRLRITSGEIRHLS